MTVNDLVRDLLSPDCGEELSDPRINKLKVRLGDCNGDEYSILSIYVGDDKKTLHIDIEVKE